MPIDPSDSIQAVERSINAIPAAAVVIVLLTGPTILWLLYRFVVQPRTSRYGGSHDELLWVCADCRSVNEVGHTRCYHCGLDRAAITGPLQVFDGEGLVTLDSELPDDDLELAPAALEVGTLEIDTRSHSVTCRGQLVSLTKREYALLEYLVRRAGEVVGRAEISEHVWDGSYDPMSNVIDVFIQRLRRKIDRPGDDSIIQTRRGEGYLLPSDSPDHAPAR